MGVKEGAPDGEFKEGEPWPLMVKVIQMSFKSMVPLKVLISRRRGMFSTP